MEARGIKTDKGNLNRLIRATNQKLREIARRIKELLQGLAEIKEQLNAPQSPVLADLLTQRLEQRNAGAWSNKAKIGNLKEFSELVLTAAYAEESEQLKPIRGELKELYRIKSKLEPFVRDEWKKEAEAEKKR